jgi:hypothetical protein
MNIKRPSKLLLALMTMTLLLHAFAPAGAALAATLASPHGQGGPVLNPGEGWAGPIAGASSDPGKLTLESSSGSGTNPTQQDYLTIYNQAKSLLNSGVDFRARQLQRLDPATCVQDRNNPNSCSFSVTGITNNYLDFNNGRLYWRYCADYDEAFVGVGSVAQEVDDPGNKLKIDPFGYCPTKRRAVWPAAISKMASLSPLTSAIHWLTPFVSLPCWLWLNRPTWPCPVLMR